MNIFQPIFVSIFEVIQFLISQTFKGNEMRLDIFLEAARVEVSEGGKTF